MPGVRLELTRPFGQRILSPPCIPFHHPGKYKNAGQGNLSLRERYTFRTVLAHAPCGILKVFDSPQPKQVNLFGLAGGVEGNRTPASRFCRPLRYHFATTPKYYSLLSRKSILCLFFSPTSILNSMLGMRPIFAFFSINSTNSLRLRFKKFSTPFS